jgi:tRNA threonylcarbamoyladenosine biosynthesis protein TsaE
VAVGREPALIRDHPGDDVEFEPVVRLALLDEGARLCDPAQERKGGHARLPAVPIALEAALDDERSLLVGSRIDQMERNLALLAHLSQMRQQVRVCVLRDPVRGVHALEQGARLRQEPPGIACALTSLVDVPARPHEGQTNGVEVESSSPEQTEEVGARLAEGLAPGDVVTVSGELGTGKTTLVRGACRALGVEGPVTSPTYTIGHRYAGRRMSVSHLDLFRFAGVSAAEWGDLEPYFLDAVCFVEWPEAGEDVLPAPRLRVALAHAGKHRRRVTVTEC